MLNTALTFWILGGLFAAMTAISFNHAKNLQNRPLLNDPPSQNTQERVVRQENKNKQESFFVSVVIDEKDYLPIQPKTKTGIKINEMASDFRTISKPYLMENGIRREVLPAPKNDTELNDFLLDLVQYKVIHVKNKSKLNNKLKKSKQPKIKNKIVY